MSEFQATWLHLFIITEECHNQDLQVCLVIAGLPCHSKTKLPCHSKSARHVRSKFVMAVHRKKSHWFQVWSCLITSDMSDHVWSCLINCRLKYVYLYVYSRVKMRKVYLLLHSFFRQMITLKIGLKRNPKVSLDAKSAKTGKKIILFWIGVWETVDLELYEEKWR
jgi:hypothetical protein